MNRLFNILCFLLVSTCAFSTPEGAIDGVFSVSATQKVWFSQGNLQYQATSGKWRFAENQIDIIGEKNRLASASYGGWIDLFSWGCSGHNGKKPYFYSADGKYQVFNVKNISGTQYDWGVKNSISNGGRKANMWRVLTHKEWDYLIYFRKNASRLRSQAVVDNLLGYVLLPDNWVLPHGCTFTPDANDYFTNRLTAYQWKLMEKAGAVFLPAAGYRDHHHKLNYLRQGGFYWTATSDKDTQYAYEFSFGATDMFTDYHVSKYAGQSVRLVQNVK